MTDQTLDLDAIQARANAATPGPWFVHPDWPGRVFAESEFNAHVARVTGSNPEPNEQFIAHAREDIPALVAEVRRLRARVTELEAGIAWRDEELRRWVDVHNLVERAINKGWSVVYTGDLEAELGPAPASA